MVVGAVITAAGMSRRMGEFKPMKKIGNITAIQRIVNTFSQVGVEPIVIVTGNEADVLEKHITRGNCHLVCLRNDHYETTEMFDSARIGFQYLRNKCSTVLCTPVDVPLFSAATVRALLRSNADIAIPLHNGQEGHPVALKRKVLAALLEDHGEGGLKKALARSAFPTTTVPVEDEGALLDMDTQEDYHRLVRLHNCQSLRPDARISLAREKAFFGPGTASLLKLISQTGSIKNACRLMHLSYSKGIHMINEAETNLGFLLIIRQPGGNGGGFSSLTEQGLAFLDRFDVFERTSEKAVNKIFANTFSEEFL